jgi:ATP/ADP translocase
MAGIMTGVAANIFTSLQAERLGWRLGALATSLISGILFFWVATLAEDALEAGRQIAGGERGDWLPQARYEFRKKKAPFKLLLAVLTSLVTIALLVRATLGGPP